MAWDYGYLILLLVLVIIFGFLKRYRRHDLRHDGDGGSRQPPLSRQEEGAITSDRVLDQSLAVPKTLQVGTATSQMAVTIPEPTATLTHSTAQSRPELQYIRPVLPAIQPTLSELPSVAESQSVINELRAAVKRHGSDLFLPLKAGLVELVRLGKEWDVSPQHMMNSSIR